MFVKLNHLPPGVSTYLKMSTVFARRSDTDALVSLIYGTGVEDLSDLSKPRVFTYVVGAGLYEGTPTINELHSVLPVYLYGNTAQAKHDPREKWQIFSGSVELHYVVPGYLWR